MLCEERLSDTIKITRWIESFVCHYVQSHCYGEEVIVYELHYVNGISFFTRRTFGQGM